MDTKRIAIAELKRHRDHYRAEADALDRVIASLDGENGTVKTKRKGVGWPKGKPRGPRKPVEVDEIADTPQPKRQPNVKSAHAGQGASLIEE